MSSKITGIILAAGKGTRIKSNGANKVSYPFLGKPIILYGVELFEKICDDIVVVVGAFSQSVKDIIDGKKKIKYAIQKQRLGTGHAVKIALLEIKKDPPSLVLIGMGDHMMFYKQETIKKLITQHNEQKSAVSFISTKYHDPNTLAWGRVERDKSGNVLDIVEQKDASVKQRKIKELNSAFYCFDYNFLRENINKIKKSDVTREYYLPDLIKIALANKQKVHAMLVHFREIGIGINKKEELEESQDLYKKIS
ncbi:MAG: sugar phosphate nucleotidyltransferase [Patescibacteria group bacterium]